MGDSFFIQGFRLISSVQAGNQFVRGHDHKASTREIKDQQLSVTESQRCCIYQHRFGESEFD